MSNKENSFDIWWNSPKVKRFVGGAYSIGASIVILGAMFKILHLNFASEMLMVGMSTEAILFGLGIFDKPFDEHKPQMGVVAGGSAVGGSTGIEVVQPVSNDDMKKLSEGIKNLTTTANQFASLSDVVGSTKEFVKNMDAASAATGKFTTSQETLNTSAGQLNASYQGITANMDTVEKNTKVYASKIDDINKSLSSINSMYEIHLKNIQAQSEGLNKQTDNLKIVDAEINQVVAEVQKMKNSAQLAATESENYKAGTQKLAKQIADLNQIYGNMLNALN